MSGALRAASPVSFNAPLTYLTSGSVTAVAVGDFNGDGNPDMAVTSYNANTVSIFLGKGDGTFQTPGVYPVGNGPVALAVGDFNHDGKPDLAVTANTGNSGIGTLSILFGKGNGTFQPAVSYPLGQSPGSIAIGDFNHDGNPDLAIVDGSALDLVYILLGSRDGTFELTESYHVAFYATCVVAADFNQDGSLDLAVADSGYDGDGQGVTIMLGNGDGTFGKPTQIAAGNSPAYLAVADFNGDGKLDLAVADFKQGSLAPQYTISLLLGNGNGTFQPATSIPAPGAYPQFVAAVDFNNDGYSDLVVSTSEGIAAMLGRGDGTFGPAITLTPIEAYFLALADFTGDGQLGLAIAGGSLTVLVREPGADFPHDTSFYAGGGVYSVAAGDFNGDGRPDLVAADLYSASIAILLGNGDGTFQPAAYYSGPKGAVVKAADINADGNLDLVVCGPPTPTSASTSITIMLGNGQGQFGPPLVATTNGGFFVVGDFNHDGKLDLAVSTKTGLVILLGNGNGTFQPPLQIPGVTAPGFLAAADFNHDGKLDLAVAILRSSTISILFGNGDASFQPPVNYPVGNDPSSIAVGHFSGSGSQDLAVANYGTPFVYSSISVLLNDGEGTFLPAVNYLVGAGPQYVAAGSFTAAGRADLAVANLWSNAISILTGNGDGTFRTPVSYIIPGNPYALALGDFSGAGKEDIAVADTLGVTLLSNTTP
jgi:hypothetical protein